MAAAISVVVEAGVLAVLHASAVFIVLCPRLAVQLSAAVPAEGAAALHEVWRIVLC